MAGTETGPPQVYTADEVAELLGVNTQTVYRLASRGEIPHFYVGRLVLFSAKALDRWMGNE